MKHTNPVYLFLLIGCFVLLGCSSDEDDSGKRNVQEIILGKIELSEGWAKPASRGEDTQAFLNIDNGTASQDTLGGISSPIAANAYLHEVTETMEGAFSMAPAEKQILAPASEIFLKPDSLHIMLIDLKKDLNIGDSLSMELYFSRVGTLNIKIPVIENEPYHE